METFRRVMRDPHSQWSRAENSGTMPIPVPLNPGESIADYMRTFEFWLAQRNVTLASLRKGDPNLERTYRFSYAQWRLVKVEDKPVTNNGGELSKPAWRQSEGESFQVDEGDAVRRWRAGENNYPISDYAPRQRLPNQWTQRSSLMFAKSSRRFNYGKSDEAGGCCESCGRKWGALANRVEELEEIVSRLNLPHTATPVNNSRDHKIPRLNGSVVIDLTDDVEPANNDDTEILDGLNDDLASQQSALLDGSEGDIVDISPSTDGEESQRLATESELLSTPSAMDRLVHTYNQLNEKVMLHEKAEEHALARLESMVGEDQAAAVQLRSQIYELRATTKAEQDKRDKAVAAVVVHQYEANKSVIRSEIDEMSMPCTTDEYQSMHEACSHIASQLVETDATLLQLKEKFESMVSAATKEDESNTPKNMTTDEIATNIERKQAKRASLEDERRKIFLKLAKSNRQIQKLVFQI